MVFLSQGTSGMIHWHKSLRKDVGLGTATGHPELFSSKGESTLPMDGPVVTQVDDVLGAGCSEFHRRKIQWGDILDAKPGESPPLSFAGVRLSTLPSLGFIINWPNYAEHLRLLPWDATFDVLRSLRHQLAWLGQTRLDVTTIASISSEVTAAIFARQHIKLLKEAVRRDHSCSSRGLVVRPLVEKHLKIAVFADASFANNSDFSTRLGSCVFLCDDSARANCVHYTSYKSNKVVRNVLGGELYALADAYEHAFLLRHGLEDFFKVWFPLNVIDGFYVDLQSTHSHLNCLDGETVDD